MAAIIEKRGRVYIKFRDGSGKQHMQAVHGAVSKTSKAATQRRTEIEAELLELKKAGLLDWKSPRLRHVEAAEAEAKARAEAVRFNDYAADWLDNIAAGRVKPRVLVDYRRSLTVVWADGLGDVELAAVTRRQVTDVVRSLSKDDEEAGKKGMSVSSIRAALTPLSGMFNDAIEDGVLPPGHQNPAARIRIPNEARERTRKIVPPTREQVEAVIKAAKADAQDAILVASATGLRRGELFGLTWADVDFDQRIITVRQSNYGAEISTTKTSAGERTVPLFESVRKVLLARKIKTRFSDPDDYVFASTIGTPLDPGNFVRREFKTALDKAKLPSFRFHDLRHYAVSSLIAEGADIRLLQAIAGHAKASITLDTYSHLMTARISEAALQFDPLRATTAE